MPSELQRQAKTTISLLLHFGATSIQIAHVDFARSQFDFDLPSLEWRLCSTSMSPRYHNVDFMAISLLFHCLWRGVWVEKVAGCKYEPNKLGESISQKSGGKGGGGGAKYKPNRLGVGPKSY